MQKVWKPGDIVAMRGIYDQRVWSAQPTIIIKDSPEEVILAILPGAECMVPKGYSNGKQGNWRRWDFKDKEWELENFVWHTNRLLVLLEPQKFYATIYFWQESTNQFLCYYINFQLPFSRSECGFDTLDLELDIIVEPEYKWRWKDEDDYQKGIDSGIILKEWTKEIELAKLDVFEKIENKNYPLNGKWLNWKPDNNWNAPKLPANWDRI